MNIYPREIEDVLIVHPAVDDVGGHRHPRRGHGRARDRVRASARPAASPPRPRLIDWCRTGSSHFKCPREVRFVDDLPRLPTGKLLKRLLLR